MRAVPIFSVILCIAAAAMLVQSRRHTANCTVIDRAFLVQLNRMPSHFTPNESTHEFDEVASEHEDELIYLTRRNDPEAMRAFLRCTLHDLSFGGCCCTKGHTYEAALWDGPGSTFWPALDELPAASQATVLTKFHRYVTFETETWEEAAQTYLATHAQTKALLGLDWPHESDNLATAATPP
ncbi:MAG: hypothetical protein JSR77_03730 [Planctomycetes bacterium]|nr:hypothetical protein [Planctomycetota bacterium]